MGTRAVGRFIFNTGRNVSDYHAFAMDQVHQQKWLFIEEGKRGGEERRDADLILGSAVEVRKATEV